MTPVSANPINVLVRIRGGSIGDPEDVTLSELLDVAFGSAPGSILTRDEITWSAIPGGIPGQVLTTQGNAGPAYWGGGGSYLMPAFTSFAISGQSTPIEVGTTISGTKTFTWSTSNSANVATNSIAIEDQTTSTSLGTALPNTGSASLAVGSVSYSTPATETWEIQGTNTQSMLFTDTYSVQWQWQVYSGSSANAVLTANQIKALNGNLQSGFAATYSISSASVVYFFLAYPDSMGDVSAFIDGNTGQVIAMAQVTDNAAYSNMQSNGFYYDLVSVTNANSVTTNYRLFRTANAFSAQPFLMKVS